MSEGIGYLMDDSRRDLASARRFRDEGIYPKSIPPIRPRLRASLS